MSVLFAQLLRSLSAESQFENVGAQMFSYDAQTGIFSHTDDPPREVFTSERYYNVWLSKFAGKPITGRSGGGYLTLRLFDKSVKAHRYAWFLKHGRWPETIDHINGDRTDNRLTNLRECMGSDNAKNRGKQAGSSRFKGLTWYRGKWFAQIAHEGRKHYLGLFSDEVAGARAYDEAALRLHGAFARLNFQNDNWPSDAA